MGIFDKLKKKDKQMTNELVGTVKSREGTPEWSQESDGPDFAYMNEPIQNQNTDVNAPYLVDNQQQEAQKKPWETDVRVSDKEMYFVKKQLVQTENKEYLIDVIEDHIPSPTEMFANYVQIYGGSGGGKYPSAVYRVYVGEDPKSVELRRIYIFDFKPSPRFMPKPAAQKVEHNAMLKFKKIKNEMSFNTNPQPTNQNEMPKMTGFSKQNLSLILTGHIEGVAISDPIEALAYDLVKKNKNMEDELKKLEQENFELKLKNSELNIKVEMASGNDISSAIEQLTKAREYYKSIGGILGDKKEPSLGETLTQVMNTPVGQVLAQEFGDTIHSLKNAKTNFQVPQQVRNNVARQNNIPILPPVNQNQMIQNQPNPPISQPIQPEVEIMDTNIENPADIVSQYPPENTDLSQIIYTDISDSVIVDDLWEKYKNEVDKDVLQVTVSEIRKNMMNTGNQYTAKDLEDAAERAITELQRLVGALTYFKSEILTGNMSIDNAVDIVVKAMPKDYINIISKMTYDDILRYASLYSNTESLKGLLPFLQNNDVKMKLSELLTKLKMKLTSGGI